MALRSAVNEGAFRNSGIAPANGDYTCVFWYKPRDPGAATGRVLFITLDGVATYSDYIAIFAVTPSIDSIYLEIALSGITDQTTPIAITRDKPVPIAYVRSGNNHSLYVEGALVQTVVEDVTGATFGETYIGTDTFSTGANDIQGFKEWNTALTLAELIVEWNLLAVTKTANLWSEIPLTSDLNDISGNARHLSAIGSPTFVTSATQVPRTNTSGATSVALALDAEYIQVNNNGSGASGGLAYKYTGVAGDAIFSTWFPSAGTYIPVINVYSDESWSTIWKFILNGQVAQEIPISEGTTLYLRFVQPAGNPVGSLYLKTYSFTQQNAVAGDILINDAVSEWPALIISPSTGEPKQYRSPFSGGDDAYKLANGSYLYEDREFVDSRIYNENLSLVASGLPYDSKLLSGVKNDDKFLIGQLNPGVDSTIEVYNNLGVFQESLNLGVISGFNQVHPEGPASAWDVIYIVTTTSAGAIKRYLRSTGAFISDFVAGIATYSTEELFWLNGNTLLAAYFKTGDAFIRRYDCTSGAILNTYTLPDNFNAQIHFGDPFPNADPQVSFWVFHKISISTSRFIHIRVSDGVVLTTFDREHTNNGGDFPWATPDSPRFAHSASCTITTLTEDIPAPPSGDGELIVIKMTNPMGLADEFIIDVGGGLTPAQITLSHGESQNYNPVTPGTYSVVEEPQSGFITTYEVSNGDPNDAIEIGAGESVTVTITNTQLGGIQVQKSTNVVSGTLFDFITTGLLPASFQLAGGQTIDFEDLDPTATYAIEEINLPAGWVQLSVVVSNGSPASAIVVDPGAVTVVVVTNTFTPNESSGIYKIEPGKTDETLWVDLAPPGVTFRRKIPDPTAKTALVGD